MMVLLTLCLSVVPSDDPRPLHKAHAHNDYHHDRPLLDALDNGFCSVEADIFLINGKLLVGHNRWGLKSSRTLQDLYLEPLKERVQEFDGSVYREKSPFTLLIDIKEKGNNVYPVLKRMLQDYEFMLSGMKDGKYIHRAIQIVISGNCPRGLIENDRNRLVAIDGRLSDLDSQAPTELIPVISAPWGPNFKWRGRNEMPALELKKLTEIVRRAHRDRRRVRFWASPESETVWKLLIDCNVDHINTDQLSRLRDFLSQDLDK